MTRSHTRGWFPQAPSRRQLEASGHHDGHAHKERQHLPRDGAAPSLEAVTWPWSKPLWDPVLGFSVNSPPILEPILVGIGMFTGGTGLLTHGHLENDSHGR